MDKERDKADKENGGPATFRSIVRGDIIVRPFPSLQTAVVFHIHLGVGALPTAKLLGNFISDKLLCKI